MPTTSKKSWETRRSALGSALRGVGLRSHAGIRTIRRLCEAGDVQLVVEAVADILLSEGVASGVIPANAGVLSKDLGYAVEAAVKDAVNRYHLEGNPLTSRWLDSPDYLVAEICKQWLASFAPPIDKTFSLHDRIEEEEVSSRLGVVALVAREILNQYREITEHTDEQGVVTSSPSSVIRIHEDQLENICRNLALALFNAFENPNETNHELLHGQKHAR